MRKWGKLIFKKILNYKDIKDTFKKINQIKNKVLVGGCFDILHYGHLIFLEKAKNQGDYLIVALESDEFIFNHKKRPPFHKQDERAYILANLIMVDLIIKLPYFTNDKEYEELVRLVRPSTIALTKGDPHYQKKKKQAKLVGAKIYLSPFIKNFSSRKIIKYATFLSHRTAEKN
ncbi:MAG: adenylyltransferase/cytidyltransferase family protein [Microgenomates group bacterium]|nr:adenylyltransferase/cytidyltransferase family protein [Microgenomates group bacterium]